MVIKASSAGQIAALVADLSSDNLVTRDAAVARLTVLGARAGGRLAALADSEAKSSARIAALRALEAIADRRALTHVLSAVGDADAAVSAAAISAARPYLRGQRGAEVVDCLTKAAMNVRADEPVRVAAIQALRHLEPSSVKPLLKALTKDTSAAIRAEVAASTGTPTGEAPLEFLARAASVLPEGPEEVLGAVSAAGPAAPLSTCLGLIERLREREDRLPAPRRARWTEIRGRTHLALAGRASRIALYDLRESLERTRAPLPADFLAALSKIGDQTCLDAIAAAYARALEPASRHSEAWRAQLAEAFQSIVRREKLTRRHAAVKRIEKRWGNVLDRLWS